MKLEGVRAIVFDLDDTLYPEREYTRSGARAVGTFLEARGDGAAQNELLALEEQAPAAPLYSRWLALRGLEEARELPALLRIHREHAPTLALGEEVRRTLILLRGAFRLSLLTDGRLAQQQAKVGALGLGGLMDAIVYADAFGRPRWKPHAAPFRAALEELGVCAAEAVYVGDNPAKDFLGANRVGMRSVRLRRPDGLHANAEPDGPESAPDAEVRTFGELEQLFLGESDTL